MAGGDAMTLTASSSPIDIWTDGACKGNPGPGGWGVFVRCDGQEQSLSGGERLTTNNRMELMAVIEALRASAVGRRLRIHLDSQYVKKGIQEWIHNWKRRGWRTADNQPVKNKDLWQELDQLVTVHEIDWFWVKGHAGDPGNERADALANLGVRQALSHAPTS